MDTLEELTIQNLLEDIFTNGTIKKRRKEIVEYYCQKLLTDLFDGTEDGSHRFSEEDIAKKVDEILKSDRNELDPYLSYSAPYYKRARRKIGTGPISNPEEPDSIYMGKAGECVVMGELLFKGYNVNNMMVDEGIDLVACKENVFFYIQVKTTSVSQKNRFYFKIKQDRFDAFIGTQMRYILVARCSSKYHGKNIFFKFSNDDIERFRFNNVIPMPSEASSILSLKIEFDERTNRAFMYDGKFREDVTYAMNNFKL